MKPILAVTLIVMGGLLVATPVVADVFAQSDYQMNAMKILEKSDYSATNKLLYLKERYPMGTYAYFSLSVGVAMVTVGTFGALKRPVFPAAVQPDTALTSSNDHR